MNRQLPIYKFTLWCLLSLWIVFAGAEIAEATHLIEETLTDGLEDQDLDEEALLQLASGIKSQTNSLDQFQPHFLTTISLVAQRYSLAIDAAQLSEWLSVHAPPSLPLFQQFSAYRI